MNFKSLLLYGALILSLASCINKDIPDPDPGSGNPPVVVAPQPYSVVEDFENGSKGAYAVDTVQLSTGKWTFSDALIGNMTADAKDGAKSVRLRTGYIGMNFDVSGLTVLVVKHAKYGNDAASTWQLLASVDGGKTYAQVGSDVRETSTTLVTDSFKVTSTTGKIRFQIKKAGSTRINLDDITFIGTGDPGINIGMPDTPPADTTAANQATTPRGTPVAGADAPPVSGDNSNLLMGNPSGAQAALVTPENYLIDQHYYIESYSMSKGEPNWVSWHLDATNTTNVSPRQDNFAGFSGLPAGWYAVQSNSYSGSGFDRGHNCPSADRTSSIAANSATFLMTNMIPQAPNNNQKSWADLENYLRAQVVSGNEVYIIMGSYGSGGVGSMGASVVTSINGGKVNVPSNVWKVAVILPAGNGDLSRVSATTRVIAVNTPNINSIGLDWKQYIVTVRDIEKATGYNLLSGLPQSVQDAVETKKDSGN
jgi:endonuclease G